MKIVAGNTYKVRFLEDVYGVYDICEGKKGEVKEIQD